MPTTETAKLYGHWLALWNGELALAEHIVARDCAIHHPNIAANPADQQSGAERVTAMVRESRALFSHLNFSLEVGPIEEDLKLAARWIGRGSYAGGMPGATAEPGTAVTVGGIDILCVKDGKIAEYWVASDALQLMQQLAPTPRVADAPPFERARD